MSGFFRHIVLWALAAGFGWATVLLAAGPLRALRLASPFWIFWPAAGAVTAGMWFAGLPIAACAFAAVALLIGLYSEIEGWGGSRGVAGTVSIVTLVASVGTGFGAWCRAMKVSPATWLARNVEPVATKARQMYPNVEIDVDMVVSQIPSILVIMGLATLAVAILSESTWLRFLGRKLEGGKLEGARRDWTDFKVWDVAIYVLMMALLAALTKHGVKPATVVGANVLNVMVVLYFFQGMAVVFKAFDHYTVGPFWRALIGFVLTFQLAILVAMVGVADYWLEFRHRLARRTDAPTGRTEG